jgi:hypothetical protein
MEQNKGIWHPNSGEVDRVYDMLEWKYGEWVPIEEMTAALKKRCRPDKVLATNWFDKHTNTTDKVPYYPLVKV